MRLISLLLMLVFMTNNSFSQELTELSYAELDSLTMIPYAKGDLRGCIPYMEALQSKSKNDYGTQDSIYAMYTAYVGFFYHRSGQFEKAEMALSKALKIRGEVTGKVHPDYALSLNNLGMLYREMGQYDKAKVLMEEGLEIRAKLVGKKHFDYSHALIGVALLYQDLGDYDKTEALYLEALKIDELTQGKASSEYTTTLNNLAGHYQTIGNLEQAKSLFLEAKNIRENTIGKEHPDYATSMSNLGLLYSDLGDYEAAEPCYQVALDIRSRILGKNHPYYGNTLNNLALMYLNKGDYKKAEPLFLEAKEVIIKTLGKQHNSYALTIANLANVYRFMKKMKLAESLFREAIAIRKNTFGKEHPNYSNSLNYLARFYYDIGQLDSALAYCVASFDANSANIKAPWKDFANFDQYNYYEYFNFNSVVSNLLDILYARYQKSKETKDLKLYYKASKAALSFKEKVRNSFTNKADKKRVLKKNSNWAENGIRAALLLGETEYLSAAFSFAEQNKSVLLMDAMKGTRARAFGDLPDSLINQELNLQKELDELKKQQLTANSLEEKKQINSALSELNVEVDIFLKSLQDKYPKYHHLKYANVISKTKDIQSLLKAATKAKGATILIEYFQTDSILYLFVLEKNKVDVFALNITKKELSLKIKALRKALSNYQYIIREKDQAYRLYTETAHWFYQQILEPGLKGRKVKNLIVVADGELGHLPFETFLVEPGAQSRNYKGLHYLLNDVTISYNYSATMWKENLEISKVNNSKMLACAAAYPKQDSSLLDLRLPQAFRMRSALAPLTSAQEEVKSLSLVFDGDFLQGEAANEQFFKKNAEGYGVIHLAMHGILNQNQAMLSSLAFTENRDTTEDNFLQAFEISRLKLNANLVVLSACETGYGTFEQGEGIVSLARSFMYAGVPSLVVSLWSVNDESTAILMTNFYQNLANGMSKDAALRLAKLDYISVAQDIAAHPAFWSPFIQLGDSRPILLHKKGDFLSIGFALLGGFILLFLLSFLFKKKNKRA